MSGLSLGGKATTSITRVTHSCPPPLPTLQRLAKARRAAAREAAARERQERAERGEVAAVVDSLVESVGAAQAFEEAAAAAEGAQAGGHNSAGGSGGGDSCSSSPRSRPRRHIAPEYEADGPASPPPPAGGRAAARPQQRRGAETGAAAGNGAAGGDSGGGGSVSGSGSGSQEGQGEVEPTAQELLSLEWLRDAPDDVARNYLMSIDGGCWQGAPFVRVCLAMMVACHAHVLHTSTAMPAAAACNNCIYHARS